MASIIYALAVLSSVSVIIACLSTMTSAFTAFVSSNLVSIVFVIASIIVSDYCLGIRQCESDGRFLDNCHLEPTAFLTIPQFVC